MAGDRMGKDPGVVVERKGKKMPANNSVGSFCFSIRRCLLVGFAACMSVMALDLQTVAAQMINVQTPFRTARDTYYERNGVNFGLNFGGNGRIVGLNPAGQLMPNIRLTQGSAGQAIPTVGGYNPNASLRTGFAIAGGDFNGSSLGLEFGKGSSRSMSSQTPSVTVMNGQIGSIFSGANRPFVTRIDPVIGLGGGRSGSSLIRRPASEATQSASTETAAATRSYSNSQSTAVRGDVSIAEIKKQRRLNEMVQDKKMLQDLQQLVDKANSLVSQGEYGAARAKLGRALRLVSDRTDMQDVREHLQAQLYELKGKR